jgi:hypothetical protein
MTNNKYNISKQLFNTIMETDDFSNITIKDGCISYRYGHYCISLNSFFFKCKNWALELGYELRSWNKRCEIVEISRKYYIDIPIFKGIDEIDAVINATSYLFNYVRDSSDTVL